MYDAIVVGARCAGSPTAMLLARKGSRVLLVDRGSFPSDSSSVHEIHQPGVARLKRWGLLGRVAASNCPPIRQQRFDVGPFALTGTTPPADGEPEGFAYAPRRTVLDRDLVEAVAEVWEHYTGNDLVTDGEHVVGVRDHAAGGAMVGEEARIVIGADGLHPFVARRVQFPIYNVRPTFTCAYYAYLDDLPVEGAGLNPCPDRMIIAGSTNDGQTMVVVYWSLAALHQVRADIEGHLLDALDSAPLLAKRDRAGRRSERFRGTADLRNFYQRPHGPGWALVGDAGHHRDPITAHGMSDAFRDAELLAEAIHDGFAGRPALPDALGDYERRRNEATLPMFVTCRLVALQPPPPEMQEHFGALRHDQEQTDRFFGTAAGIVPLPEFFSPETLDGSSPARGPPRGRTVEERVDDAMVPLATPRGVVLQLRQNWVRLPRGALRTSRCGLGSRCVACP